MKKTLQEALLIPEDAAGSRLDQALSELLPDYSRALIQSWIKSGWVQVDGQLLKPKSKLLGGEQVTIEAEIEEQDDWKAEDIPLDIIFEDEHILVINKPAGLVVHPAAGNRNGTLLNALLFHEQQQALLPRAGIVHRLDKDTSGLMVVAKSLAAHTRLVQQIQNKEVTRQYLAIAFGEMTGGKTIEASIGRHPSHRTKMAVLENNAQAKDAITHIRLLQRFKGFSYVLAQLETGRTHQIRVHMSHIGFPLVGDPAYGGKNKYPKGADENLKSVLNAFNRQALHATYLALEHPITFDELEWEQDPPEDFLHLLSVIEKECAL
jgi:23S rRNA pseudouridine1911/1915/1917 synthase